MILSIFLLVFNLNDCGASNESNNQREEERRRENLAIHQQRMDSFNQRLDEIERLNF